MASPDAARPIIIKRKKVVGGDSHHGGAWKVAYADFVTAMMAFFLLMWLLNATTEDQRKGLADYFNPDIPVSRSSTGGAGMLNGETIFTTRKALGPAKEGIPPKPTHRDPGKTVGDNAAAPDLPDGEHPAHAGPGEVAAEAAGGMPGELVGDLVDQLASELAGGAPGETPGDLPGQAPGDLTGPRIDPETGTMTDGTIIDDAEAAAMMATMTPGEARIFAAKRAEQARLEAIGRQIAEAMERTDDGSLERHFVLRITPEGLVIEIIDVQDQALFGSASAAPSPILPLLIDVLVPVLEHTVNDIAVVGHTDAVPFERGGYSNWELSADRANAARRLLAARGLPGDRVVRVTGKAAVEPLLPDPFAPQNRRIAITLLRQPVR